MTSSLLKGLSKMGIALNLLRLSRSVDRRTLFQLADSWQRLQPQWNWAMSVHLDSTICSRPEAYTAIAGREYLPKMLFSSSGTRLYAFPFPGFADSPISIDDGQHVEAAHDSQPENCSRRAFVATMGALLSQTCFSRSHDLEPDAPDAFPQLPIDAAFLAKWHRAEFRRSNDYGRDGRSYVCLVDLDASRQASIAVGTSNDVDFFSTNSLVHAVAPDLHSGSSDDLESDDYAMPILDFCATPDGTALAFIWNSLATTAALS